MGDYVREIYNSSNGEELSENSARPIAAAFNEGYAIGQMLERCLAIEEYTRPSDRTKRFPLSVQG
jgi:hypothetical protein